MHGFFDASPHTVLHAESAPGLWTLATAPPVAGRAPGSNGATIDPGVQPLGPGANQAPPSSAFPSGFLFMMVALFVLMIVLSSMGQRKERKRRNEMLTQLGRYDRVTTTGGLIGTIVELKDEELVLKVDEATNTRIHVVRSAVQQVLKKGRSGSPSDAIEPAETA